MNQKSLEEIENAIDTKQILYDFTKNEIMREFGNKISYVKSQYKTGIDILFAEIKKVANLIRCLENDKKIRKVKINVNSHTYKHRNAKKQSFDMMTEKKKEDDTNLNISIVKYMLPKLRTESRDLKKDDERLLELSKKELKEDMYLVHMAKKN